jgi:hypothetical protein
MHGCGGSARCTDPGADVTLRDGRYGGQRRAPARTGPAQQRGGRAPRRTLPSKLGDGERGEARGREAQGTTDQQADAGWDRADRFGSSHPSDARPKRCGRRHEAAPPARSDTSRDVAAHPQGSGSAGRGGSTTRRPRLGASSSCSRRFTGCAADRFTDRSDRSACGPCHCGARAGGLDTRPHRGTSCAAGASATEVASARCCTAHPSRRGHGGGAWR